MTLVILYRMYAGLGLTFIVIGSLIALICLAGGKDAAALVFLALLFGLGGILLRTTARAVAHGRRSARMLLVVSCAAVVCVVVGGSTMAPTLGKGEIAGALFLAEALLAQAEAAGLPPGALTPATVLALLLSLAMVAVTMSALRVLARQSAATAAARPAEAPLRQPQPRAQARAAPGPVPRAWDAPDAASPPRGAADRRRAP